MLTDGPAGRAVAAVLLVIAWVLTWRPALDPDLWWHLALGDRIIATGVDPDDRAMELVVRGSIRSSPTAGRGTSALAAVAGWAGLLGVSLVGVVLGGVAVALAWWLLRLTAPDGGRAGPRA